MNILAVTQYFWPESFRVNDPTSGLRERGHEVTVLTGMPNYPSGRVFSGHGFFALYLDSYEGVALHRVPLVPIGQGQRWRLALNYFSFAISVGLFAPFRCCGSFDLIFIYELLPITVGIPAIVLKKLKRVSLMLWVQDLWPESLSTTGAVRSELLLHLVAKLVCFIYRPCDRILVQSEGFIPSVMALGADPRRVAYSPNWAENFYHPVATAIIRMAEDVQLREELRRKAAQEAMKLSTWDEVEQMTLHVLEHTAKAG